MKMIEKLIKSKLNPVRILNNQNRHILKNISMHYLAGLLESLKPKPKKLTFRLIVKSFPKLKNLDNAKLDPFSHLFYSGVYEVPFIYRASLKRSNY